MTASPQFLALAREVAGKLDLPFASHHYYEVIAAALEAEFNAGAGEGGGLHPIECRRVTLAGQNSRA